MALAHFKVLIYEFLSKDTDIVPEEAPLVVLDSKSDMCMAKNGKVYQTHNKHCKENVFCKECRKVQYAQN